MTGGQGRPPRSLHGSSKMKYTINT